jgi:hypothetical protein
MNPKTALEYDTNKVNYSIITSYGYLKTFTKIY